MFEKQYDIKDKNILKNKIINDISDKYKYEIADKNINIKNNKDKIVFKGEIYSNPVGCVIKGEFPIDRIISRVATVIVILYIIFLLATYYLGLQFYDYQILLMIIAVASIVIMKKIGENRTSEIRDVLENIK